MGEISVLFVDDEESIRANFMRRFSKQFDISLAGDGAQAVEFIKSNRGIQVVVTDIRMPNMDGFELISLSRSVNPDLGFIVVSGHGDYDDVVRAMRLGARNFFKKPYEFAELEEAVKNEGRRYDLLQRERLQKKREHGTDEYLVRVENLTYRIPNDMALVTTIAFRLVRVLESMNICNEDTRQNTAIGLMELITNAIEHGNLELSGERKVALKQEGEAAFSEELARRANSSKYNKRTVNIVTSVTDGKATIRIEDEGPGFDLSKIPDPTDPMNLFKPSGRGILLAQMFLDEVTYNQIGNAVTVVKYKNPPVD